MFRLLSLSLLLGVTSPLLAQDFEAQIRDLRALRMESLADLSDFAPGKTGQFVELRGTVKGVSARGEGFSFLLALPNSQTLSVDAPASLRQSAAAQVGNFARLLCEITGTRGRKVELRLRAATSGLSPHATSSVQVPVTALAPLDDGVIIGQEVELPSGARPVISGEIPVLRGNQTASVSRGQTIKPFAVPKTTAPNTIVPSRGRLASRGAQTRPQPLTSRANPYFGFSDSHRANYAQLARSNNPRLSYSEADEIAEALLSAAQTHGLDPRFLAAVVTVESRFNPRAVSGSGALGLGQLMPFNLRPLGVQNPWVPMQNLHGAAKMLRQNLNIYGSRPDGTLLAVAAYHAGIGAVRRAGYRVPKVSTNKYAWKVYYAYKALAPELFR